MPIAEIAVSDAALPPVAATHSRMSQIVWASMLGTVVEWYDFLIYGTAAALVFNKLFFPSLDPLAGTLAAFASYAVGFAARPLGGVIFGHYGDRLGRKTMLMATMLIMGAGTFLIGCLPTYNQIGLGAPILLVVLRLLQGIGIGGEWGGAVLMVIEHAPSNRRGLHGSLVQIGFPAGIALSTASFLWLSDMPEAAFLSWGWRLPFLASAILIVVGLFVRLRLTETPVFARIKAATSVARAPVLDVLMKQPRTFLIAVGLKLSEVGWVYMLTAFFDRLRNYDTASAARADPQRDPAWRLDRIRHAAAVRLGVGPHRSPSGLFRGGDRQCLVRRGDLSASRHEESDRRGADDRRHHEPDACDDVRAASGVPSGTLRHPSALQRRVPRLSGVGGDLRRARAR